MRAVIQSRFAVLKLRSTLREVENICVPCRKCNAKPGNLMMSDLHRDCLGYQRPVFCCCRADYFSPFHVAVCRSSEKRWGFSSLAWRHEWLKPKLYLLWMASFYPTEELCLSSGPILARTLCELAEKELMKRIQTWDQQASSRGIKWNYSTPHHDCSWQPLVRSCKRAFYSILGTRKVTPEVLDTTFCLVEQSLNKQWYG